MTKASRPLLDPLSEARYRLQVTGSVQFRDKLLRARELIMHTNPSGDLAVVVERALDELIEKLEKRIFGKLSRKSNDASIFSIGEGDVIAAAPVSSESRRPPKENGSSRRPGLARAAREASSSRGGNSRSENPKRAHADDAVHLRQRKSTRAMLT